MKNGELKFSIKQPIELDLSDTAKTALICKALSSETRLDIIKKLITEPMTISQLSKEFYMPLSSMCLHVKLLQEADIIKLKTRPGSRGNSKLCAINTSIINIDLFSHVNKIIRKEPSFVNMPIGKYTHCDVTPPCGLASSNFYLHQEDSPYGFYQPSHTEASLLWFTSGILEYSFPNDALKQDAVDYIEFSFEICAEAPGYNNEWPSDIELELNGTSIFTFHIKGDYGGRRGIYNPDWWSSSNTQYGELKIIRVTHTGCYCDQKLVSTETIDSLGLMNDYYFSFGLKVDTNAEHMGGMNLFGEKFGDYSQDIVMKVEYVQS